MNDSDIIDLYWARDEAAISASSEKYGRYCHRIAMNILLNHEDAEECVNDTWLRAWNSMPPHRPSLLSAFLGKITRNLSFHLFQKHHALKRGGGQIVYVLDELKECSDNRATPENELELQETIQAIQSFLTSLPREKRIIFVKRYWYAESITDIAKQMSTTKGNISVILTRMRKELKQYLFERGTVV